MSETKSWIPMSECKHGYLYVLNSRNLGMGVFVNDKKDPQFIGIREKFGREYLTNENHWDCGPPYGTARPIQELGKVPDGVGLFESYPTKDSVTGRPVYFTTPVVSGGKGWCFKDTDEPAGKISAVSMENGDLRKWIEEQTKKYYDERERVSG